MCRPTLHNNRRNSHQPTRERERRMKSFAARTNANIPVQLRTDPTAFRHQAPPTRRCALSVINSPDASLSGISSLALPKIRLPQSEHHFTSSHFANTGVKLTRLTIYIDASGLIRRHGLPLLEIAGNSKAAHYPLRPFRVSGRIQCVSYQAAYFPAG